ncbi:MAG: exonuclease [Hyellaceae cyanobacterium CSU_1_1]|nr:exonuclease [Hyellaceae cyanobacterium CSU_1_1]
MDFIVIDTEGRRELTEIAIINSQGKLIYEAFNQDYFKYTHQKSSGKPLKTILSDFKAIAEGKILVFHNAEHDLAVLAKSFSQLAFPFPDYQQIYCTYRQAQRALSASSYSLEYLAKKLNLKVNRQYFNREQAHVARYDAQFTYQLYLTIKRMNSTLPLPQINPFGSSRVDNPFQNHPDNSNIYHPQYNTLESVIDDIKYDQNHQSKGAVIIGSPGTGKTHLIMRLAQQRLKLNRLLFIPCPNDANTIKYHTYSSILESLNRSIPGTQFNQLEYFLANTFVGIIKSTNTDTQKIQGILNKIQDDPLKLYKILGGERTQDRRNNWDYVEKFTSDWWFKQYGAVGYAPEIIKGIVKFCRYSDPGYKQLIKKWLAADELEPAELDKIGLSSWHDEISKEDFSLDAIAVFGKLSLLHEPLIIVFDQLEMLGLEHNRSILLNFGEAVKEIFTRVPHSLIIFNLFPNRWQQLQQTFDGSIIDRISQYQVFLEPPTEEQTQAILQLKAQAVGADLTNLFTPQEIAKITQDKSSIRAVLNYAAEYFRYKYKNIPLPDRQTKISEEKDARVPLDSQLVSRLERLESQQYKLEQLLNNIAQAFNGFVSISPATSTTNLVSSTQPDLIVPSPNLEKTLAAKVRDYLLTQQEILEQDYHEAEILLDEKDIGKLQDIIEAFKQITELETDILPSKRVFPPHRLITNKNLCIGFISSCKGNQFTSRLQNFNTAVATQSQIRFILWRDSRSDAISPKTVGGKEIDKLNQTKNGEFRSFTRSERITFELLYKFVSDIYNQDLDINLETELQPAIKIAGDYFQDYWLMQAIL